MGKTVTDADRRKLREVEGKIQEKKKHQEDCQDVINRYEDQHHRSSQEQDEGELSAVLVPVMWTYVHKVAPLH